MSVLTYRCFICGKEFNDRRDRITHVRECIKKTFTEKDLSKRMTI